MQLNKERNPKVLWPGLMSFRWFVLVPCLIHFDSHVLSTWCPIRGLLLSVVLLALLCVAACLASITDDCLIAEKKKIYIYIYYYILVYL